MKCLFSPCLSLYMLVAPPCGERGLKSLSCRPPAALCEVAPPCGERGLKCHQFSCAITMAAGRSPLRGAWIEMVYKVPFDDVAWVAPPCGERGLKYHFYHLFDQFHRRSPLRGAWIEIIAIYLYHRHHERRSPLRGAWIEMSFIRLNFVITSCRSPLRGAWIEIFLLISLLPCRH